MYEFSIQDKNFKIENSTADDAVTCSIADTQGNWSWVLTENTDAALRGDETVTELLNRFLTNLNEILDDFFGVITNPPEFNSPLEELNYRIDNNINLVNDRLELNI